MCKGRHARLKHSTGNLGGWSIKGPPDAGGPSAGGGPRGDPRAPEDLRRRGPPGRRAGSPPGGQGNAPPQRDPRAPEDPPPDGVPRGSRFHNSQCSCPGLGKGWLWLRAENFQGRHACLKTWRGIVVRPRKLGRAFPHTPKNSAKFVGVRQRLSRVFEGAPKSTPIFLRGGTCA